MVIKVGINGFGRIGRIMFRTCVQNPNVEVTAINDPAIDVEYICYLIKFDSTHGNFNGDIIPLDDEIKINGNLVKIFHEKLPSSVQWHLAGVQYVIESSGMFTNYERAVGHLAAEGVRRVVVTAPSVDVPMLIMGVNNDELKPDEKVISSASSTLYCLATIIKVLENDFGIGEGFVTSIHAMTPSLKPLDGLCLRGKHWRDYRSIHQNVIPATTGACKALGKILPQLKDKLVGLAFRVPIVNVSVLDLTVRLNKHTSMQKIVETIESASKTYLKGVLNVSNEEAVSSDFMRDTHSCILDVKSSIQHKPNFYKFICWYENEFSYACRVIDTILFCEKQSNKHPQTNQMKNINKNIIVNKKHVVQHPPENFKRFMALGSDCNTKAMPDALKNISKPFEFKISSVSPCIPFRRKAPTRVSVMNQTTSCCGAKSKSDIFKIVDYDSVPGRRGFDDNDRDSCVTLKLARNYETKTDIVYDRLIRAQEDVNKMMKATRALLKKTNACNINKEIERDPCFGNNINNNATDNVNIKEDALNIAKVIDDIVDKAKPEENAADDTSAKDHAVHSVKVEKKDIENSSAKKDNVDDIKCVKEELENAAVKNDDGDSKRVKKDDNGIAKVKKDDVDNTKIDKDDVENVKETKDELSYAKDKKDDLSNAKAMEDDTENALVKKDDVKNIKVNKELVDNAKVKNDDLNNIASEIDDVDNAIVKKEDLNNAKANKDNVDNAIIKINNVGDAKIENDISKAEAKKEAIQNTQDKETIRKTKFEECAQEIAKVKELLRQNVDLEEDFTIYKNLQDEDTQTEIPECVTPQDSSVKEDTTQLAKDNKAATHKACSHREEIIQDKKIKKKVIRTKSDKTTSVTVILENGSESSCKDENGSLDYSKNYQVPVSVDDSSVSCNINVYDALSDEEDVVNTAAATKKHMSVQEPGTKGLENKRRDSWVSIKFERNDETAKDEAYERLIKAQEDVNKMMKVTQALLNKSNISYFNMENEGGSSIDITNIKDDGVEIANVKDGAVDDKKYKKKRVINVKKYDLGKSKDIAQNEGGKEGALCDATFDKHARVKTKLSKQNAQKKADIAQNANVEPCESESVKRNYGLLQNYEFNDVIIKDEKISITTTQNANIESVKADSDLINEDDCMTDSSEDDEEDGRAILKRLLARRPYLINSEELESDTSIEISDVDLCGKEGYAKRNVNDGCLKVGNITNCMEYIDSGKQLESNNADYTSKYVITGKNGEGYKEKGESKISRHDNVSTIDKQNVSQNKNLSDVQSITMRTKLGNTAQDIYDKLDSASATNSDNSFDVNEKKSQVIRINDLTDSLEDLGRLEKICKIIEISDDLSDVLFAKLQDGDGKEIRKKWSFKDLCEKINLDDFCKKVFHESDI